MPIGVKCGADQQVSLNLVARSWPVSGPILAACCTPDFQSFMVVAADVTGKPDTAGRTYLASAAQVVSEASDSCQSPGCRRRHTTAVVADRQAGQARWTRILSYGRRWFGRRRQEMNMALRAPRARSPSLAGIAQPILRRENHQNFHIVYLACLIGTLALSARLFGECPGAQPSQYNLRTAEQEPQPGLASRWRSWCPADHPKSVVATVALYARYSPDSQPQSFDRGPIPDLPRTR